MGDIQISRRAASAGLAAAGLWPVSSTFAQAFTGGSAEFQALLKSERDIWWPVIRTLGLSLD